MKLLELKRNHLMPHDSFDSNSQEAYVLFTWSVKLKASQLTIIDGLSEAAC